jgi:hypothetical protein
MGEGMSEYWVGIDLGQAQDFTALVVARRRRETVEKQKVVNHYDIAHIRRYPLGTPYPVIVAEVVSQLKQPPFAGKVRLIIDGSGVGRAVVDLFREPLATIAVPITITASGAPSKDDQGYWRVAKRDLIGAVSVLLQTGRLKIAAQLEEAPLLTTELQNYEVKISDAGHDSYNARGDSAHDDLVLATAMACWAGESGHLFGRPFTGAAGGTRPQIGIRRIR